MNNYLKLAIPVVLVLSGCGGGGGGGGADLSTIVRDDVRPLVADVMALKQWLAYYGILTEDVTDLALAGFQPATQNDCGQDGAIEFLYSDGTDALGIGTAVDVSFMNCTRYTTSAATGGLTLHQRRSQSVVVTDSNVQWTDSEVSVSISGSGTVHLGPDSTYGPDHVLSGTGLELTINGEQWQLEGYELRAALAYLELAPGLIIGAPIAAWTAMLTGPDGTFYVDYGNGAGESVDDPHLVITGANGATIKYIDGGTAHVDYSGDGSVDEVIEL